MPITAELLRSIVAEARPIIERQMNDALIIAGLRKVVSANGGDWSALKALIKAHVEDEADDDGEGKRVRKILDKADSSTAYADMLGLAKMNEENFSSANYSEAKGREPVQEMHEFDPETGELTNNQEHETEVTTSRPEAVANSAADIDTPATGNGFADDVGATASSTNPHSPDDLLPVAADTAGGVAPPAPPATHSDDIDLTIPDFLRRTEGGYPKRESVEA